MKFNSKVRQILEEVAKSGFVISKIKTYSHSVGCYLLIIMKD